ncbi:PH domain-containing protein [Hallella absiana]|uniref:PH domain-containing protein n=1 Tax=Hallella absiana TaxID=2925336 RepID=UPI0021C9CA95|nr:PH domain-containing protein [Hallella absiana]
MDRTFQHRFTLGAKSGIIILSLLAFYLFWTKGILAALIVVAALVAVIERVLHSCYILRGHDLIIHRGRFLHDIRVPLSDIRAIRPMTTTWGLVHYLLIEYGSGKLTSAEPNDEDSFLRCLRSRIHEAHGSDKEEGKEEID